MAAAKKRINIPARINKTFITHLELPAKNAGWMPAFEKF
jgi:hypothetical protein